MGTGGPTFNQLNLIVRDVKAAVAFYRLLGLSIDTDRPFSAHHVAVKMPGLLLELDSEAFVARWCRGWNGAAGGGRNVIGFGVLTRPAVDDIYVRLTSAGYRGQQEPSDAFWGARYAVVEDPDGNPVGLMSPVEARFRSAPPEF